MVSTVKVKTSTEQVRFLDSYTRVLLSVMFVLLLFIFGAGKYMDSHKMAAGGTDDLVNNLATVVTKGVHHPFVELPGDAQLGAFSVANFFAGLIVGHYWEKIFEKPVEEEDDEDAIKVD